MCLCVSVSMCVCVCVFVCARRCYWENRDVVLFVLETLDRQHLSHDFFETATGRSWLSRCEQILTQLVSSGSLSLSLSLSHSRALSLSLSRPLSLALSLVLSFSLSLSLSLSLPPRMSFVAISFVAISFVAISLRSAPHTLHFVRFSLCLSPFRPISLSLALSLFLSPSACVVRGCLIANTSSPSLYT